MGNERDILKSLLLKEELELLNELNERLSSKEQFTEEVSKVLSGAVNRAQKKNRELERALSVPIQNGVQRAFATNKQLIIDALLPIMGQLIRKTVSNSIKQFVVDINRTLELGFSTKAIKWRWQAYKTGSSFAEIVFQKTIRYQVIELFLINRKNGLLIEHVGTDDLMKDNNAISAMLTVIQDFIGDSLQSPNADLLSAEIDDNVFLISTGPKAFLASVVKGSPTERLKEKSQKLIENVHAEFSEDLIKEELYRNNTELIDYMRGHLITKNISAATKKLKWQPWVAAIILGFAGLFYWTYQRNQAYRNTQKILSSVDGLYVKSIKRKGSEFQVEGLLDPLADISKLKSANIVLHTHPFVSLDKNILSKRLSRVFSHYKGVDGQLIDQKLLLRGKITAENLKLLMLELTNLAGIESIDNQTVIDNSRRIEQFINLHKTGLEKIDYEILENSLILSGSIEKNKYAAFQHLFKEQFKDVAIDDTAVIIIDKIRQLVTEINETIINISKQGFDLSESKDLDNIIKSLQSLIALDSTIRVIIIGHSDCQGKSSNKYSMQRALKIKDYLMQNGIGEEHLMTEIQPCRNFNMQSDDSLLNISFKI
jgi:OOP family OmpA-OmpF porin